MMRLHCAALLLLLLSCAPVFSQHSLDDLFKGGRKEYANLVHKKSKYGDAKQGRYGLCLFSFTVHSNDSINNFSVLSSPSKLISERTLEVLTLSHDRWVFPKTTRADSLNILAGFYYVKVSNDKNNGKIEYTRLDYDALYKDYCDAGFETDLPDVFSTPFTFIGIITVKRYGAISVE